MQRGLKDLDFSILSTCMALCLNAKRIESYCKLNCLYFLWWESLNAKRIESKLYLSYCLVELIVSMQRGLKDLIPSYRQIAICVRSQCKEDWKGGVRHVYRGVAPDGRLNAKRIESFLLSYLLILSFCLRLNAKRIERQGVSCASITFPHLSLNAKRIESSWNLPGFRSSLDITSQCKEDWKMYSNPASFNNFILSQCKEDWKPKWKQSSFNSSGHSLNAKRIESSSTR